MHQQEEESVNLLNVDDGDGRKHETTTVRLESTFYFYFCLFPLGGFKSALQLKQRNPRMKIMIAIGGWAEGGKQYSEMVSSATTRKTFIDSVVKLMEKYKFDG